MAEDLDLRDARPLPVNVAAMTDEELARSQRIAADLAKSGVFKDVRTAHQAFAKMLIGRDLGISPTQALMGMDFVKGNIQLRGTLLANFVRRSPDYDYRIVSLDAEMEPEDEQHCTLRFFKLTQRLMGPPSQEALEPDITYTFAMAKKTGNVKEGSAWYSARRNMLLWRAMSDGVKFHAPDLLAGLPVYAPEEIPAGQDVTAGEGEYVEPEDIPSKVAEWAPSPEAAAYIVTILDRARELGHAGIADYGTAELALKGQSKEAVGEWGSAQIRALDNLAARPGRVEEAQVVDDQSALELEQEALRLADEADAAEVNEELEKAEALRAEAAALHGRVAEMTNPQQMEMNE